VKRIVISIIHAGGAGTNQGEDVLHPVDYEVAGVLVKLQGEVAKLDNWELQIARHLKWPLNRSAQVVRQAIDRLESTGVVVTCTRSVLVQDGQICPNEEAVAGLFDDTVRVEAEIVQLNYAVLDEVRLACGKDLFREPELPAYA